MLVEEVHLVQRGAPQTLSIAVFGYATAPLLVYCVSYGVPDIRASHYCAGHCMWYASVAMFILNRMLLPPDA